MHLVYLKPRPVTAKSYYRNFYTPERQDVIWRAILQLVREDYVTHIVVCGDDAHGCNAISLRAYATNEGHALLEKLFA